ncbi:MAG: hypothetical protein ACE5JX_20950 [Acidobacteriota bacterium]
MSEDETRKDVFAWFGSAYYAAQCFEVELCILLILAHRLREPTLSVEALDEIDRKLSQRTLGFLIRELPKHFEMQPEFEVLLGSYLEKRNFLAHRFFYERASSLLTAGGSEAMVEELRDLYTSFKEADEIARIMSARCRRILGISEELVQEELDRFLATARQKGGAA